VVFNVEVGVVFNVKVEMQKCVFLCKSQDCNVKVDCLKVRLSNVKVGPIHVEYRIKANIGVGKGDRVSEPD
jgi:hypothetical protein